MDRTPAFACLHIPEFPAWAFTRSSRPRHAVVVVHAGRVVAATRAAHRAGVAAGMSAERALALAPDAAVRVRDPALEAAAWEAVTAQLLRTTPNLECPATGTAILGRPDGAALRAVATAFGATAATATDRNTARLGAARAAPGHVLSIAPDDRPAFLARFPVERLEALAFEPTLAEALRLFGYDHLAAVETLAKRQLEAQFGPEGARLYGLLHSSADDRPVAPFQPPPTITASVELDPPCREPVELLPAIDHLVAEAARSLDTVHARRVAVRATADGEEHVATRILPEAVCTVGPLGRTARALLIDILERGLEVDHLAVELGGLAPAGLAQAHLFHRRPPVYLAIRGVHRRFPGAIMRAIVVEALFPEERAHFEAFPEPAA